MSAEQFIALMDDLHRALVLKVYFSVCEADQKWSSRERFLAEELFDHLWGKRLTGEELRTAARRLSEDATKLKWYSIVRPFDQIVPLAGAGGHARDARDAAGEPGGPGRRRAGTRTRRASSRAFRRSCTTTCGRSRSTSRTSTRRPARSAQQAIETLKAEAEDIYAVTRPDERSSGAGGREQGAFEHELPAPRSLLRACRRRWRSSMR